MSVQKSVFGKLVEEVRDRKIDKDFNELMKDETSEEEFNRRADHVMNKFIDDVNGLMDEIFDFNSETGEITEKS
jgi:hypothetical protein